jgi:carbon-monoxide dehydrogenase medium subunit
MLVQGPNGTREIDAADFFVTYLTTALEPGEVLTEIRFPTAGPRTGTAFRELVRRKGDFAIVAAAATVQLAPDGTCLEAHVALSGVAPTPTRARAAEAVLRGQPISQELLREAAVAAASDVEPDSDVMASADYRRAMAEVFARRALTAAAERAVATP